MDNDITIYLSPVDIKNYTTTNNHNEQTMLQKIYINEDNSLPDLKNIDIAIVGIEEDRNSLYNNGCGLTSTRFRDYFYKLAPVSDNQKIIDMGNIKKGNSVEDSYFALKDVLVELIKNNVVVIIIGGSQDITYSQYIAYEELEQTINLVNIDRTFDISPNLNEPINSNNYMSKIMLKENNRLFNYANIGYQTYYVGRENISLMNKLYFGAYRLGEIHNNIEEVEPVVRNADTITFDMSSIRHSDSPAYYQALPNGFYGEEACQITRYAGLSDKLTSIGFYELNPKYDKKGISLSLLSQMIWYFIDGFYNRMNDIPNKNSSDFIKYEAIIANGKYTIPFYKSKKSNRWWMEVTYPVKRNDYFRHTLIPCSYNDYLTAIEHDEIPDKWWQAYQKMV